MSRGGLGPPHRNPPSPRGLIPQNPLSTSNPERTVLQTLSRPLRLDGITGRSEIADRAADLVRSVELDPALLARYPDAVSGGRRQRLAIARAIMELIDDTRRSRGIGALVISHDMTVIAPHRPRIGVLGNGTVVERGRTEDVLADPRARNEEPAG